MRFLTPIRPLLKGWLLSFLGWGLVGVVLCINFIAGTGAPWTRALHSSIRDQLPWAILTPLVFRFTNRHLIDKSSWKRTVPLHFLLATLIIWSIHQWKELIDPVGPGPHRPSPTFSKDLDPRAAEPPMGPPPPAFDFFHFASVEIPIYIMIVSAAHTLHFYRRSEMRAGQLARARLQAIQTQLRPHFLFNTLNTIAGLVHKAPDKAESVVQMLSDLLRFSLKANPEAETSLLSEIEFAEKYLAIMHVRFDDRVRYEFQISPNALSASIPTLLLQPIIENAIKHGLESKPEGGTITIRAWCDPTFLYLQVSDTGVGVIAPDKLREGVGLTSTRARLREFYGDGASLEIQSDGGTTVAITIPFRSIK
jgi:two-component system LytT family sensor kinase